MSCLGLKEGEIPEDQIQKVTNEEEHQYLDSYIPSNQIGGRALSSVLVTEAADGKGNRCYDKKHRLLHRRHV